MHASFDIRTAKDYVGYLVHPSHKEYQDEEMSARKAIQAAIFCWHLKDWVWAQQKTTLKTKLGKELKTKLKDPFGDYLLRQRKQFEAIQGIANGSKHFKRDRKQKEPSSTSRGWDPGGWDTADWEGFGLLVELGGKNIRFSDILNTCVKYWDEFFQKYLPSASTAPAAGG